MLSGEPLPISEDGRRVIARCSSLEQGGLGRLIKKYPNLRIIRVEHGGLEAGDKNLLDLAMKYPHVREVVVALANRAFFAYMLKDGVTSFVHFNHIGTLWKRVSEGPFEIDQNGLVYTLQPPLGEVQATRLMVVFSSMAGKIRTPSLMRHFEQNFSTIQKYLPVGTAVLRIADFGGVVGGYYMNTHAFPSAEDHVQELVRRIAGKLGMAADEVVLYGGSKGGSAALYHGLVGGFRVVAVDPVLADEYYVRTFKDSHFTTGVFPEDKRDKFARLSATVDLDNLPSVAIICSRKSPQFPYITSILTDALQRRIAMFDSCHPDIRTHPDVSLKTLNIVVMLMNMMLYKLPVRGGMHVVDEVLGPAASWPAGRKWTMGLIAHRGGSGVRVENTLAAFEHALALGSAGAELDVHLSRDEQVVVHHDDVLNDAYCRHVGGDWIGPEERLSLAGLSYTQMLEYEIGTPKPGTNYARRFDRIKPVDGQHIPLLRDVIRLVKARSDSFRLVIEIKASILEAASRPWQALVDATLAVIKEEDFVDRTILCSFDWGSLLYALERCPEMPTWFTTSPLSWFGQGQPPRQDLRPRASHLEAVRGLYATGDAPWFAGFDPRRFDGSFPQAIAAAGGNAWFPYYRDCTPAVCRELAQCGLDCAAWSVNLRDRQAILDLALAGVDHLVMDYPDIDLGV